MHISNMKDAALHSFNPHVAFDHELCSEKTPEQFEHELADLGIDTMA